VLGRILPEEALEVVERERDLLGRIRAFVDAFEPDGEEVQRIDELIRHLDEMFLLVVVGEVKAGKSAFINALLREEVCPEGPLPLTDRVHVLGYGEKSTESDVEPFILRRTVPVETLERMNVVDTPGTNSPVKRHQEITEGFLPRADIVFFVTSIDCPLTQTELELLGSIRRRWRKEVACILAKVDIHPDKDREVVLDYLHRSFREHLDFDPVIFPVSAHQARRAREEGDEELLEASGLPAVERYIVENLSEGRRVALKLSSPLGAATDLLGQVESEAEARREVLDRDFAGWTNIQEQISFSGTSLKERAERHLTPLRVAFENLESRGRTFLRETIRLRNLRLVGDQGRFKEAFEREVVRSAVTEIERGVDDAVTWLGGETRALWERSLSHFNETVSLARYRDEILAGTGPRFEETRRLTLDRMLEDARKSLGGWSVEQECRRVRGLAARSLARLLGAEVAAAGMGAIIAATLLPSVLGGVGIALAAAVAVGGLFMLPARRQKAIEGFETGLRATRDAVLAVMRESISAEADRAVTAVLDAFAPFHDFYEGRRAKLAGVAEQARGLRAEVSRFQSNLDG
jgi:hypothetical protein